MNGNENNDNVETFDVTNNDSANTQNSSEEVFDLSSSTNLQSAPVMPENVVNEVNEEPVQSKHGGGKKIVVLLLILIIALACGFGYVYLKADKPDKLIDNYTKMFKTSLDAYMIRGGEEINFLEDDFKWTTDISFNTNDTQMTAYNDLKLKFDGAESTKNEFAKMDLVLMQGSANQTFNTYFSGKDFILEIVGIENGVLKQTLEQNPFDNIKEYANNKLSREDINYILEKYVEYFGEAIKEANPTMKESINEITYSITIDKDAKERINKKFNELVAADEKLSKLYKEDYKLFETNSYKYYGSNSEEKDDTIIGNLTINRFTKEVERFDYKEAETTVTGSKTKKDTFEISYVEKYENLDYEKNYKVVITEKDKQKDYIVYDKNGKELANGSISWSDKDFNVTYNDKETKAISNFKLDMVSDKKMNVEFTYTKDNTNITVNFDSESGDKKINNNGTIKITADSKEYSVLIKQTIDFGPNLVQSEPLKDGRDINSLTAEEQEKLTNDLFNKLSEFEFLKSLSSFVVQNHY